MVGNFFILFLKYARNILIRRTISNIDYYTILNTYMRITYAHTNEHIF